MKMQRVYLTFQSSFDVTAYFPADATSEEIQQAVQKAEDEINAGQWSAPRIAAHGYAVAEINVPDSDLVPQPPAPRQGAPLRHTSRSTPDEAPFWRLPANKEALTYCPETRGLVAEDETTWWIQPSVAPSELDDVHAAE